MFSTAHARNVTSRAQRVLLVGIIVLIAFAMGFATRHFGTPTVAPAGSALRAALLFPLIGPPHLTGLRLR